MKIKAFKIKELALAIIVSALIFGSLGLAIKDEQYRPTFADLAKIGLGAYIGANLNNNDRQK